MNKIMLVAGSLLTAVFVIGLMTTVNVASANGGDDFRFRVRSFDDDFFRFRDFRDFRRFDNFRVFDNRFFTPRFFHERVFISPLHRVFISPFRVVSPFIDRFEVRFR